MGEESAPYLQSYGRNFNVHIQEAINPTPKLIEHINACHRLC